jgi:predicted phosphoribosyltransferase
MPFADRREAGRQLGAELAGLGLDHPVVLGQQPSSDPAASVAPLV